MIDFVKVGSVEDVLPGTGNVFELDEETVAIFNIDGAYYCIADVCTHDGGPLADGDLAGCEIECPRHGARFDLRTGAALSLPAVVPVPTYKVKVVGGDIYVGLSQETW